MTDVCVRDHSENLKKLQSAKVSYIDRACCQGRKSSGLGLLDRSEELVSESRLMTPVVGDRKIYDFIPSQKIGNGSPGSWNPPY